MRGVIPGLAGEISHILYGLLGGDLRHIGASLVVTVKARPADSAHPLMAVAVGIIRDHHAGMQPRALG